MKTVQYLSFLCVFLGMISPALSNGWVEGLGYKARLLLGEKQADGSYMSALDLKLDKGYITYWRNPGDHGIPPSFNFDQSQNISKTKVYWPSPIVMKSHGHLAIGYKDRLVVPFKITPAKKDEKITLDLNAFIGVCAEICVPADIRLSHDLKNHSVNEETRKLIEASLKTVPTQQDTFQILANKASVNQTGEKEFVDVEIRLPENIDEFTLLAEGPKDWYLSPFISGENKLERREGKIIARIPLFRDFKDPIKSDQKITLTMIFKNHQAIEKAASLK